MKNKLIPDGIRKDFELTSGHKFPEERRSGRSTVLALKFITKALSYPGLWIEIVDHYPGKRADQTLLHMVQHRVKQLGLKYVVFKHEPPSIKSDHMSL